MNMNRRNFLKLSAGFTASAFLPIGQAQAQDSIFDSLTSLQKGAFANHPYKLIYVGVPFELQGFSCGADLGVMEMAAEKLLEQNIKAEPVFIFPHIKRNPQDEAGDLNVQNPEEITLQEMSKIWPNVHKVMKDPNSKTSIYTGSFEKVSDIFRNKLGTGYFNSRTGGAMTLEEDTYIVGHHRNAGLFSPDEKYIHQHLAEEANIYSRDYITAVEKHCNPGLFTNAPDYCDQAHG